MSREFRVWDKQTKSYDSDREFVLASSGQLMELYSNHNGTWDYHFADGDRFIVEQYTGIEDKNDKEIAEGDIIHFVKDGDARVLWAEGKAMFCLGWLDCGVEDELDYNVICRGPVEIIGTIHENGELLENKK